MAIDMQTLAILKGICGRGGGPSGGGGGVTLDDLETYGVPHNKEVVLLKESVAYVYTHPQLGKAWCIEKAPALTVGETYKITYNGVPYNCVCQPAPAGFTEDPDAVAMGNFSIAGGANTGEPFAMLVSCTFQRVDIIDLAGSNTVKVAIAGQGNGLPYIHEVELYVDAAYNVNTLSTFAEVFRHAITPNAIVRGRAYWTNSEQWFLLDLVLYTKNSLVFSMVAKAPDNAAMVLTISMDSDNACTLDMAGVGN